jgi:hypothetical protein
MPRVSNKKAREYVKRQQPFRGSNIFARDLRNGAYCVWSYTEDWPLYLRWRGNWFGNDGWYSRTTYRHKTLLCPSDKVNWLPRSVLQMFVAYCNANGYQHQSSPLNYVLQVAGLAPETTSPPSELEIPEITTHPARTAVDWGAVHRRRLMPV